MPTIVHFEIPTDDMARAMRFYSQVFDWSIQNAGMPGGEYYLIMTEGENPVNGGMMQRQHAQQGIVNYIGVPSVDEYASRVQQLGGNVVVPTSPIPGVGYFAIFQDTEGNVWGLFEDDSQAR